MTGLIWVLLGIIGALMVFIAWREYCHDCERKDLYNRIMATSLTDYSTVQERPAPRGGNFVKAGIRQSLNEMGRFEEAKSL